MAEIYSQEKFSSKRDQQYDKLINSETSNLNVLNYLKNEFEKSKDNSRLSKVNKIIEERTSTKDIIEDVSNLTKESDPEFLKELNSN